MDDQLAMANLPGLLGRAVGVIVLLLLASAAVVSLRPSFISPKPPPS